MRRSAAVVAVSVFASLMFGAAAEAQESYRVNGPLRLNVRARNFLELSNNVAPYSQVNPASAYGQTVSYLNSPPYGNLYEKYGQSNLPDPITNGPFIGAVNPIGPVDYGTYAWFR